MTNEERQQVIDALRFAEDVIDTDDYSLTLIYAALAIMRREREPVAWARRWFIDGETPAKVKNENNRMEWPIKFKFLPVSQGQCQRDDVPLYKD